MSDQPRGPVGGEPLTHDEALEMLDDWRDGELSDAEAARVKAHVESCERCQRVEAALGGRLRDAIATSEAPEPAELLPGVQRRIRLRSRGRFYAGERRGPSPWPLVVASLAVLGALVVSYLLLGQVGSPTPAPASSGSARPPSSATPPPP
ncbi:MAG: hypothetical protein NVS3B10_29670 [Polyangiales bacterium]